MGTRKLKVAYFGTCGLVREVCPACEDTSFVIDGQFACCGRAFKEGEGREFQFKIESASSGRRAQPSHAHKQGMLAVTRNRCVYCGHQFGEFAYRKEKLVAIVLNWDHFIPFSLSQANPDCNFLPACQICNRIKSKKIFESIADARAFIRRRIGKKGYTYAEEAADVSWMPTPNLSAAEEQALLLRQMQIQGLVKIAPSRKGDNAGGQSQ